MTDQLLPCPFCGCACAGYPVGDTMSIEGEHNALCPFHHDDPIISAEAWNTRAQPADCEPKPVESPTAWEMVALDKDGEVYRYALRKEQTTNRDALYCWGGTVAEQFKIEHRPLFTHPAPVTLLQWVENDRYCPHCNVEIDELEGTASSAPAGVVLPEYKNRRDQYGYLYPDDRIWNACREETARLNGIKP